MNLPPMLNVKLHHYELFQNNWANVKSFKLYASPVSFVVHHLVTNSSYFLAFGFWDEKNVVLVVVVAVIRFGVKPLTQWERKRWMRGRRPFIRRKKITILMQNKIFIKKIVFLFSFALQTSICEREFPKQFVMMTCQIVSINIQTLKRWRFHLVLMKSTYSLCVIF